MKFSPCILIKMIPAPMGTPATICGHGLVDGELAAAKQNIPTGRRMAPSIMRISLFSLGRPILGSGERRVLVVKTMSAPPRIVPVRIESNGSPANVGSQLRSRTKDMG